MSTMQPDNKIIQIEKIKQCINLQGKLVLEIGCADGRIACHLAAVAREYIGVDPDSASIEKARSRKCTGLFRVGSGENLDFATASFDVVLFTLSLHHQDCEKALSETKRILKNQGEVLILEPAVDGEVEQLFRLFSDETASLQKTQRAIQQSGLQELRRETFFSDWTFQNKQEVYRYDFSNGEKEITEVMKVKMDEIIGARVPETPIRLKDKIILVHLRKVM